MTRLARTNLFSHGKTRSCATHVSRSGDHGRRRRTARAWCRARFLARTVVMELDRYWLEYPSSCWGSQTKANCSGIIDGANAVKLWYLGCESCYSHEICISREELHHDAQARGPYLFCYERSRVRVCTSGGTRNSAWDQATLMPWVRGRRP